MFTFSFSLFSFSFFYFLITFSDEEKKSEKGEFFKNSQKQNVLFSFPNNPDEIGKIYSKKNQNII